MNCALFWLICQINCDRMSEAFGFLPVLGSLVCRVEFAKPDMKRGLGDKK